MRLHGTRRLQLKYKSREVSYDHETKYRTSLPCADLSTNGHDNTDTGYHNQMRKAINTICFVALLSFSWQQYYTRLYIYVYVF